MMNRIMTDVGSALASVVGKIRVGSFIPARWILPGHLHLPQRIWERAVLGQLLVYVPQLLKSSAVY